MLSTSRCTAVSPREARIREMDAKTGASLKLTVLNDKGRVARPVLAPLMMLERPP